MVELAMEEKIYIIGGGISGLVAALELEKAGYAPIILEGSSSIGGRMKTDSHEGFLLDHGFQVLNTAYPEAKRYLDFEALHIKTFDPGAVIFNGKETLIISDPIRNPLKIFGMAFSRVGTFFDKVKMFTLTRSLKNKTLEEIFNSNSIPTHQYLEDYGFSQEIIHNFFKPFFRGIFLEKHLNTSSRMFEFVFKMFSEGKAAVPEKGMGEIPAMLRRQLSKTQIYFNSSVKEVRGNEIEMENGNKMEADRIIIAVQPDMVMKQLQGQFGKPQTVINLYFSLQKSFISKPMIGLLTGEGLVINLVFMNDVSDAYSENGRALLSVTVLDSFLSEEQLIQKVKEELQAISGVNAEYFQFIRSYHIPYALPKVDDLKYQIPFTESKIMDQVYLAGDYLLNGSINAAMTSGRIAAEAVIHSLMPTH
jgi:protoporphyrinogen oxidase